jgi:hypothetical protein
MSRPNAVNTMATIAKTRVFMLSSRVHLVSCERRCGGVSRHVDKQNGVYWSVFIYAEAGGYCILRDSCRSLVLMAQNKTSSDR